MIYKYLVYFTIAFLGFFFLRTPPGVSRFDIKYFTLTLFCSLLTVGLLFVLDYFL